MSAATVLPSHFRYIDMVMDCTESYTFAPDIEDCDVIQMRVFFTKFITKL